MPGSSILTILSPILTITHHTFLKLIAKKRSPQQENSYSSSEDDTPLCKYQLHKPSVGATNLKKIEARDRTQYLHCGMDQLFTQEEMAASNIDGKRKKRKLDETRVDLLKRKLKFIIVWFLVLEIPCFSNNLN